MKAFASCRGSWTWTSKGTASAKLRLNPGDCLHITPGMKHRMIAVEECDVLEVSTPELDDVVRLEDRYGRVPQGKGK